MSTDLKAFVRGFLAKHIRRLRHDKGNGDLLVIARQCLSDFNHHVRMGKEMDSTESTGAGASTAKLSVMVSLIDHSTRKVMVKENATLIEVGDALASQIRLGRIQDFRFFQLVEADKDHAEVHRLLPMPASVKTILAKMETLKEKTQRRSQLLLKRVFMGKFMDIYGEKYEELRAGDMVHANLTYKQAIRDFLHYPIYEDRKLVLEIAAAVLVNEHDSVLEKTLKTRDLSGAGVLEKAMPAALLEFEKDRKMWSTRIIKQLEGLQSDRDPQEARLQAMTRVFRKCQDMRLFGSMHWFAKQRRAIPPEGLGAELGGLPKQHMAINKKAPEDQYWICVTRAGISFVPFQCGPGEDFQRKFLFDSEAMSRLVRWGFSPGGKYFGLVVSACDPDNPAAGVVEWVISMESPSSPDICFGIQSSKGKQK